MTYKKGTKIRVTMDIVLPRDCDDFVYLTDECALNRLVLRLNDPMVKSVQVLEEPKPDWYPLQDGDVFTYNNPVGGVRTRYAFHGKIYDKDHDPIAFDLGFYNRNYERVELKYRPEG